VHEVGTGASLSGDTKLCGQVPGGQAEFLRARFGTFLPIKVADGPPDDRFLSLVRIGAKVSEILKRQDARSLLPERVLWGVNRLEVQDARSPSGECAS
jgi:hypothetical protein